MREKARCHAARRVRKRPPPPPASGREECPWCLQPVMPSDLYCAHLPSCPRWEGPLPPATCNCRPRGFIDYGNTSCPRLKEDSCDCWLCCQLGWCKDPKAMFTKDGGQWYVLDSSDVYQLAKGRRCSWGDIVSTGFVSSEHLQRWIGKESPYCSEECIFRG